MSTIASQITGILIIYSTVCSGTDQRKKSKLCITGHWEGNLPVTGEIPTQRASNTENISIWWCHHAVAWLLVIISLELSNVLLLHGSCHVQNFLLTFNQKLCKSKMKLPSNLNNYGKVVSEMGLDALNTVVCRSGGWGIGIDHDTVYAGVVGTGIWHSTSCAGRRDGRHNEWCAGLQYQPRQRRPYKW